MNEPSKAFRLSGTHVAWALGLLVILGIVVWLLVTGDSTRHFSAGVRPSPGDGRPGQPVGTEATVPASGLGGPALSAASVPVAQADPFKAFLEAQKNGQVPPAQPVQRSGPATGDPFAQALEESRRRQAAAVASPFGASN